MLSVTDKISAKMEQFSKLVGSDYDPKRDRNLFGQWTDDLVQALSSGHNAEEALAEAVRMAQQDSDTEFNKILASGKAPAVKALGRVIRWAEEVTSKTLGPTQFVAMRILGKSIVPDVSHVQVKSNMPELVNAGPITDEELSYFENPPSKISWADYSKERSKRTPTKDSLPETYPPLTREDIGKDADIDEVMNSIRFFLGSRDVGEEHNRKSKSVKEPPIKRYLIDTAAEEKETTSEGKGNEKESPSKVKNLIYKLLGHVRDEKYKVWEEARKKMLANEKLNPDEEKYAKIWSNSISDDSKVAKTLGRSKQQLSHAVDEVLNKHAKQPGQVLGGYKIVAQNAGYLNEAIVSLKDYLKNMSAVDKDNKPQQTKLRDDLKKLKEFIDRGGYKPDMDMYKGLLGELKNSIATANLTPEQKEAIYWLFPRPENEEQDMKTITSWVKDSENQHNRAKGEVSKLESSLSKISTTNRDEFQKKIDSAKQKTQESNTFWQQAKTISEPIASKALRAMRAPYAVRSYDTSNKELEEAVNKVYADILSKNSEKGAAQVKRVLDLVKGHILTKHEADELYQDIKSSKTGNILLDLDYAKQNENRAEVTLKGVKSLVSESQAEDPDNPGKKVVTYELKDPAVRAAYDSADKLVQWVFEGRDKNIESLGFNEITEIVKRLNDIRLKLIKLARTTKTSTDWDYGTGWMYRTTGPGSTKASQGLSETAMEVNLSDNPENWITNINNDSVITFLETKSKEMASEGKGRPEDVAGPSYSQIPEIVKYLSELIRTLKAYDPNVIRDKLIKTAIARSDLGSMMRSLDTKKSERALKKKTKEKYKTEGIESIEPKNQKVKATPAKEPEPVVKESGLADLVKKFMAKMAAMRVVSGGFFKKEAAKGKIKNLPPAIHTKRLKPSGPTYLNAFFINPDGADEFVHELQRGGFDFLKSLAMQSGDISAEDINKLRNERSPERQEQGKPARGWKLDIDDIIAKTMTKGSATLHDHILKNKDRMADLLKGRSDKVRKNLDEAKSLVTVYRSEAGSQELKDQLEFLKALAAFIRNPQEILDESVPRAFPESAYKERKRTLKGIQGNLAKILEKIRLVQGPMRKGEEDLVSRRNRLKTKYERQGINPETQEDYRYTDKVIKQVEKITPNLKVSALKKLHDDLPEYDKIKNELYRLKKDLKDSDGQGSVDPKIADLENRVAMMEKYLKSNKVFQDMQKLYPADSTRYTDPETEKLYKEQVKGLPEEKVNERIEEYEQRSKELSELSDWDDFKSWIRKIQKPKKTETMEGAAAEAAQAKGRLAIMSKRLTEAEDRLKVTDPLKKEKVNEEIVKIKGQIKEAEKDVQETDKKLARMHARKKGLGDIQPGEHDPHEGKKLWDNLMEDVKKGDRLDVTLGEKEKYPKTLIDLASESVITHIEPDKYLAGVKSIERNLEGAGANEYPVLKQLFGNSGDWNKTKNSVLQRLNSMESGVSRLKDLLDEAKNKMVSLSGDTQDKTAAEPKTIPFVKNKEVSEKIDRETQSAKQIAEAEVIRIEKEIANILANQKVLRDFIENVDKLYAKQVEHSRAALPRVTKEVQESISKPLYEVSITNEQVRKKADDLISETFKVMTSNESSDEKDKKLSNIYQSVADLEMNVDVENDKISKEISSLNETGHTVDQLYEGTPERQELITKIDNRRKQLSSLLLKKFSAKDDYLTVIVKKMKSDGLIMSPKEENEFVKQIERKLVPSVRYIPNIGGKTKEKTNPPTVEQMPGVVKKASEGDDTADTGNIESWLKSAPRQYLEELPRIGINDWSLIESLYGERKAEYKDLIRGNQMVIDGPAAKDSVKKIMGEADRLSKEVARLGALKNLKVPIAGRMVNVSNVGNVFNRELSSYLTKKNRAQIKLEESMSQVDRLQHELESYAEFVDVDDKKKEEGVEEAKPELKMELTDRETQAIADQFYRGLYWYLQEYWTTKSGTEAVFGSRESVEFSKLFDAFRALAGVRSNPTIQKVVMAGSKARQQLRSVKEAINKTASGFKRIGQDPSKVIEEIAKRYGGTNKEITSFDELKEEYNRMKRNAPFEGQYKSGVQLYFLQKYREALESQIQTKNAMYDLLREVIPVEYKISVLESIKSNVKDSSLVSELDRRIKSMREDISSKVSEEANKAEKDIDKIVSEGVKTQDNIEVIKGLTGELLEEGAPEKMDKQASYMSHPSFDAGVFYGAVLQAKIADMAAQYIRSYKRR